MMMKLAEWAQRIVTFRAGAVELLGGASWVFKAHMFLGMTIFLVFPFTRLVHVWSGFGAVAYAFRPYQMVRSRKLNLPAGHLSRADSISVRPEVSKGQPARRQGFDPSARTELG